MVLFISPFGVVEVVTLERVLASFNDHTSVVFMVLPLKSLVVTIVSDLPSADHVAVDLLSPLPVVFTLSFPSSV